MLRLWLDKFSAYVPKERVADILDLGCGTGRHSEALARQFEARVIGIDPSESMLSKATEKCGDERVTFQRGHGEALPLAEDSLDLILMSMVFHHLEDPAQVARECHRVLRQGGTLLWRNSTLDRLRSYPYFGFFPGIEAVIGGQLRPLEEVRAIFETADFWIRAHELVTHEMAPDWGSFIHKMGLKADSFIARLSDEDFEAGMTALQAEDREGPVTVDVDFFVFSTAP